MSKKAFLFPGQGSQYVGMGKDLYENSPLAKEIYDKASEILNFDLKKVSFEGPLEELKKTNITQPAIYTHSVINFMLLKEKGFSADYLAGHSLGEYSALASGGVISFEEGLEIVKIRGEAMYKAGEQAPGTMAAIIGLKADKIIEICEQASGIVKAANFNSSAQIVISGEIEAVKEAMKLCKEAGAKIVKELVVSGAFHSPLMEKAAAPLKEKLDATEFKPALSFIVPNVSASPTKDPKEIKELLIKQLTSPVRWEDSVNNMVQAGVDSFVECGPGKVLQGLNKRIAKKIPIIGIDTFEQIENL